MDGHTSASEKKYIYSHIGAAEVSPYPPSGILVRKISKYGKISIVELFEQAIGFHLDSVVRRLEFQTFASIELIVGGEVGLILIL